MRHSPHATPDPHALALDGVDELPARVFRAFMRTIRLHHQLMSRTMAEHGAPHGQAMCLRMLESNDGITQRDLTNALHLARPTVSKMLRGMEQAGLVRRQPDARDQRLVRVSLTASGRTLAHDLSTVAAAHINRTVGSLSAADLEELARLLDELAAGIARVLEERAAGDDPQPSSTSAP